MLPITNLDLVWNVALGIIIGVSFLNLISQVVRMWKDNWKVTLLIIPCATAFPATVIGAFLGYFGWVWLFPGFIAGCACHFVATNILLKEEGGDSGNY